MDAAGFRARLLAGLLPPLRAADGIDACFEGGSAATGRLDDYSDIDLYFVAAAAADTTAVFEHFERALARLARIAHVWRVEPSPFPGLAQRHYLIDPAPPHFGIECCVLRPEDVTAFLERERHGEAIVHFDHSGRLRSVVLDRAALAAKLARRYEQIRASWPVYRQIVAKEVARGRALDAFGFYVNGLLRPLIELAGMRYRPERFDFGWRYLHHDLPAELQRALTQLAYVGSIDDIAARLPHVDRLMAQLAEEIAARPSILARATID
jgi:predicted nucleotidyltransferase